MAAPVLLHLPQHHCAYDLLPRFPEITIGLALFAAASFAVGWAWVACRLGRCPETEPFLRGAVQWLGFRATTVPFRVAPRRAGASKYGWRRMFGLATGAILSYSTRLLHLGIWIGLATSLVAFVELIVALIDYTSGRVVPGWISTIGFMLLLFGILFVLLGIIGLYLARIHRALQSRPLYIVADMVVAGEPPAPPATPRRLLREARP